jgi:hypothetical protein
MVHSNLFIFVLAFHAPCKDLGIEDCWWILQIFGVQKHSIGFCFKWIEYFVCNVHILKLDQNTSLT